MGLSRFWRWRRPMYQLAAGCRSPLEGNSFERFRADLDGIGSFPQQNEVSTSCGCVSVLYHRPAVGQFIFSRTLCSLPDEKKQTKPPLVDCKKSEITNGDPELLIRKTKEVVDEKKVGTAAANFEDLNGIVSFPHQNELSIHCGCIHVLCHRPALGQTMFSRTICSLPDEKKQIEPPLVDCKKSEITNSNPELLIRKTQEFVEEKKVGITVGNFGNTEQFKVTVTQSSIFAQQLAHYKDLNNDRLAMMDHEYNTEIRQLFVPSGLILPSGLKDSCTAFLHYQSHLELGRRPSYVTSFDLTTKKNSMTAKVWDFFAGYIITSRTFIVEDMQSTYGNIESQSFDLGVVGSSNGELYCKGECDAAFRAGKADLSCVLWDQNQIIWSEVIKEVECPDSTTAEVLAAILLIIRCIELRQKLPKLKYLALYSDSKSVVGVINGDYTITFKTKNRDDYLLLRSLSQHFESLICVWKPRTLNFMADFLLKEHNFVGYSFAHQALKVFGPHIAGMPIFRISQNKEAGQIMEHFKNQSYRHEMVKECFLEVKAEDKFDAFMKVKDILKPGNIRMVIHNLKDTSLEFQAKVNGAVNNPMAKDVSTIVVLDTTVITVSSSPSNEGLCVVFDASIPEKLYFEDGWFNVILVEPNEVEVMKLKGLREMDAMFYTCFRGVRETIIQKNTQLLASVRLAHLIKHRSKVEVGWHIKDGHCRR